MSDTCREIQELLVDYAGALRDGCIPTFLKSLTREEAKIIASSDEFWEVTEMVRLLNSTGFANKAAVPSVDLFIARVDAKIMSRLKKAKSSSPAPSRGQARTRSSGYKHRDGAKPATYNQTDEKAI